MNLNEIFGQRKLGVIGPSYRSSLIRKVFHCMWSLKECERKATLKLCKIIGWYQYLKTLNDSKLYVSHKVCLFCYSQLSNTSNVPMIWASVHPSSTCNKHIKKKQNIQSSRNLNDASGQFGNFDLYSVKVFSITIIIIHHVNRYICVGCVVLVVD